MIKNRVRLLCDCNLYENNNTEPHQNLSGSYKTSVALHIF